MINGVASSDEDTSATAEVSITIRDVNDEPPKFNKKEYHVRIPENLVQGSPLPNLDMTVSDTDIVSACTTHIRMKCVLFNTIVSSGVGKQF